MTTTRCGARAVTQPAKLGRVLGLAFAFGLQAACGTSHTPGTHDGGQTDTGVTPGTLDACFAGLAPTGDSPFVGTLRFESVDGTIEVRLARQPGDRPAVGETWAYDMVRFGIARDGVVTCITQPSALAYDFGHHNWADVATAEGTSTFVVSMRYEFTGDEPTWVDTLQIDEAAPITLRATACDVTPNDLNHCLLRSFP
ncbi:MAG: hypothetical protein KC668_27425 [Myxococcales bacterium]|nr:hypothetical protein [Myxococcales bacterium]